jgi:FtsP/CotA-like multicopper oxidase with cupredoxin domain
VALQLVFDGQDSGDETDPSPEAWRLPSGAHDVPLVLHDRAFDANGRGYFDLFDLDGLVGDKVTVNGRIQPYLRVVRRKYRFRIFNVGPARSYRLHLSNDQEMVQVGEDGGMLVQPRRTRELELGVGRSADVVLDLAPHVAGTQLFLIDVHERRPGGRPTGRSLPLLHGARILRLDVDGRLGKVAEDPSRIPDRLMERPSIDMTTAATTRTFVLERAEGSWTVNGRPFNPDFLAATPKLGTAEVWTFVNRTGVELPALELHLGLHDVIARGTGTALTAVRTRGSVIDLAPGETVTVWRRFADFTGTYTTRSRHGAQADQGLLFRWRADA